VLVNNAGISRPASSIEEIDENVARAVWETNFWAPFRLIRAVLPHMRAQHSGVIVNLSTFGARFPGASVLAMYAISKHAISRLSESLQAELAGTGVRVVAIGPGFFATEIYNDAKRAAVNPSSPYAAMVAATDEAIATGIAEGADPALVAQAIVTSADNPNTPTCLLVGDDAIERVSAYRQELITAWQTEPRVR
jgi:NAD(P)-dependent dehydrogenase (short-subunit alcohol dehydrogenase family)